jgi:hypothetical protein
MKNLLKVFPICLFKDNYSYFLPLTAKINILVDPADPDTVF